MHDDQKLSNDGKGAGVPPAWDIVLIYFIQCGKTIQDAKKFFNHFSRKGWLNRKGDLVSNWKVIAWQWIWYHS